ncbi:unnamed protein product [Phytophthora fragariaefolia]|uniref:Unnamed protein product n=1 Tax=Phytophthora fragariaefolia TaxID=1490495 RepID=A0A9W6UCL3_9STRA|nr:unnamed protein product [Phytophthora fragariaefolia]
MEKFPYREAVGSFMYLMMGTRSDLANFVRQVSRYLHNPGPPHWNYVLRGLKYLNGTRDYGITLGARDVTNATLAHALNAYSDTDYANNVDTRRSISGYVTVRKLANFVAEFTPKAGDAFNNGGTVRGSGLHSARSAISQASEA